MAEQLHPPELFEQWYGLISAALGSSLEDTSPQPVDWGGGGADVDEMYDYLYRVLTMLRAREEYIEQIPLTTDELLMDYLRRVISMAPVAPFLTETRLRTAASAILHRRNLTRTAQARVQVTWTATKAARVRLQRADQTTTRVAAARVRVNPPSTRQGHARLRRTMTPPRLGRWYLNPTRTLTVDGQARLHRLLTLTRQGRYRLLAPRTLTRDAQTHLLIIPTLIIPAQGHVILANQVFVTDAQYWLLYPYDTQVTISAAAALHLTLTRALTGHARLLRLFTTTAEARSAVFLAQSPTREASFTLVPVTQVLLDGRYRLRVVADRDIAAAIRLLQADVDAQIGARFALQRAPLVNTIARHYVRLQGNLARLGGYRVQRALDLMRDARWGVIRELSLARDASYIVIPVMQRLHSARYRLHVMQTAARSAVARLISANVTDTAAAAFSLNVGAAPARDARWFAVRALDLTAPALWHLTRALTLTTSSAYAIGARAEWLRASRFMLGFTLTDTPPAQFALRAELTSTRDSTFAVQRGDTPQRQSQTRLRRALTPPRTARYQLRTQGNLARQGRYGVLRDRAVIAPSFGDEGLYTFQASTFQAHAFRSTVWSGGASLERFAARIALNVGATRQADAAWQMITASTRTVVGRARILPTLTRPVAAAYTVQPKIPSMIRLMHERLDGPRLRDESLTGAQITEDAFTGPRIRDERLD